MAVTEFGNTVVEALSTDTWPDKDDGWFLKATDTGDSYIRRSGVWVNINLGFAFIKATKSGSVTTDGSGDASVTFISAFVDNDYTVVLTCTDQGGIPIALITDRLATGFSIKTKDGQTGLDLGGVTVAWLATRDYDP